MNTGTGRPGLFLIEVDDGRGCRPAPVVEVDSDLGHDDGPGGGPPNQTTPPPASTDAKNE